MNRKISIFAISIASIFIGVPVDGFAAASPAKETTVTTGSALQIRVVVGQPRRRRARRGGYWRNGRYYRNYGQYRRSVVGNRRYRTVPRYYWRDGRRVIRYQRIYY